VPLTKKKKNNGQINAALCTAFNDTIQELNVSEVDLSDRLYAWSNKQPNPILAKLDRVFTNNPLDSAFPMLNLSSLPRPTSDHSPLLLSLRGQQLKCKSWSSWCSSRRNQERWMWTLSGRSACKTAA
jgi:hypothetical protein